MILLDNIIGNIYGDMKVLSYEGKTKNHIKLFKVKCIKCGHEKIIQYARLNSLETCYHSNKHCGIYIEEYDENIGLKINDYTIIKLHSITKNGYRYIAKCDICRTEFETYINNFKRGYGTKHKECTNHIPKNKYLNRFRKIYSGMIYRTNNPNDSDYKHYGGRGIKSDAYNDFMVFYYDLFESYRKHVDEYGEKDTTLDRIDVNGNYEPSNVRWATMKEQANNTRNNIIWTYNNISHTISEWSDIVNIERSTLYARYFERNWDLGKVLNTPLMYK